MTKAGARIWPQPDGQPVSCRDKLDILNDNYEELRHVMQDAFEDAILMGVDEAHMRTVIAALVAQLKAPKA
jgi:hypothetical protein